MHASEGNDKDAEGTREPDVDPEAGSRGGKGAEAAETPDPACGQHPEARGNPGHSTLFLDQGRLRNIRRRLKDDERTKRGLAAILKQADDYVTETLTLEDEGIREMVHHAFVKPYGRMLLFVSFASRILAEEAKPDERYAEAARRIMKLLSGFDVWETRWTDRVPNWQATFVAGGTTVAFAAALSWLEDCLDNCEQEIFAQALLSKGVRPLMEDWIWPGSRIHALDSMGHNFWAGSVAAAGVGALALRDYVSEAEGWVGEVEDSLVEWCEYPGNVLQNKVPNFGADGGYYESLSYAGIITWLLQFEDAHRSVFGRSANPRLKELPQVHGLIDYFVHGSFEASRGLLCANFGDQVSTDWMGGEHGDQMHAVMVRLAALYGDGNAQWLAAKMRPYPKEPFGLMWLDDSIPAPELPTIAPSRRYHDIGWGIWRDRWGTDATLFAAKSGMTWNHAHPDAGSFILWANGEPLIVDSGSVKYGRYEYINYYCKPAAHNVVLHDGQNEPGEDIYRGAKQPGSIPVFIDTPDYKYMLADATGPNCATYQRFFRHIMWVEDSIVIVDDLLAHKPGTFEWLFHPAGKVELPGGPLEEGSVRHMGWTRDLVAAGGDILGGVENGKAGLEDDAGVNLPSDKSGFEGVAAGIAAGAVGNVLVPAIHTRNGDSCLRLCAVWPAQFDCEARGGWFEQDRSLPEEVEPPKTIYYALRSRPGHSTRAAGEIAFQPKGIQAELDATGREEKFVVVLNPYRGGGRSMLSSVTPIEGANWKGVRLTRPGRVVDILLNLLADGRVMHHNSINSYGQMTTDASILVVGRSAPFEGGRDAALRETGEPSYFRIHNGSFLRQGGRPVIESPLKGDFLIDRSRGSCRVRVFSERGFGISVGCPEEPRAVRVSQGQAAGLEARGLGTAYPKGVRYDASRRLCTFRTTSSEMDLSIEF